MLKLAKTRGHTVHTPMNKTWVIITIRIESQQVNDYYPSRLRNITEQYSCDVFFLLFLLCALDLFKSCDTELEGYLRLVCSLSYLYNGVAACNGHRQTSD